MTQNPKKLRQFMRLLKINIVCLFVCLFLYGCSIKYNLDYFENSCGNSRIPKNKIVKLLPHEKRAELKKFSFIVPWGSDHIFVDSTLFFYYRFLGFTEDTVYHCIIYGENYKVENIYDKPERLAVVNGKEVFLTRYDPILDSTGLYLKKYNLDNKIVISDWEDEHNTEFFFLRDAKYTLDTIRLKIFSKSIGSPY